MIAWSVSTRRMHAARRWQRSPLKRAASELESKIQLAPVNQPQRGWPEALRERTLKRPELRGAFAHSIACTI